jgi:hypothetical protein
MCSAALGRGLGAVRAPGGERGPVCDRVGERPGDDTGRGSAAGPADPSDDRGDGLDVQAGQPAEDGPVPLAEVDPAALSVSRSSAARGAGPNNDPSSGRSASSAWLEVSNGPSTVRSLPVVPSCPVSKMTLAGVTEPAVPVTAATSAALIRPRDPARANRAM